MEKIDKLLGAGEPVIHSVFRAITGLMLFQFGVAKLLKFPLVPIFEKAELFSVAGASGTIELIFGGLLMIGLFSRFAAFILCGEMAFAYFIEHLPRGLIPLLNNGNLAIILCFSCLFLACAGGGPWSVDALVRKQE
jgi:putative oxidoreductase